MELVTTAQLFVLIFFMLVGKIVNGISGRPLMNGAKWYLVQGAICFPLVMLPVIAAGGNGQFDDVRLGEILAAFFIPGAVALHYSRKFSGAQRAPSPARP
ncbi:hypothetical protein ATI61_114237 [Archangium gephyra]|uniref:Uncharacterized protein n=1 Tax=Archangium gephyra TaxID=48 RepID=A0AAC8Q4R7_9BACT|nr:hypothetical protein [Archangium gephyra]AKJ01053.1 Hypothetical protein AA314_02679 [Archangium gephyra]REG24628.1 hypothetical protein ATI61_114237 [Archangium gephyra]